MENNQTNINNGCQHVQLGGMAFYDESKYFMFSPDEPEVGSVAAFRMRGVAQQMTDGTFDFVAQPRPRAKSELIKKLAHGRVSKTVDGAIQLTLKVFCDEGVNIGQALAHEANDASQAVVEYQLRR